MSRPFFARIAGARSIVFLDRDAFPLDVPATRGPSGSAFYGPLDADAPRLCVADTLKRAEESPLPSRGLVDSGLADAVFRNHANLVRAAADLLAAMDAFDAWLHAAPKQGTSDAERAAWCAAEYRLDKAIEDARAALNIALGRTP